MRYVSLLLALALGACRTHVVSIESADPSGSNPLRATFDVPPRYIAASGHRTVTLKVDASTWYTLDIDGRKAWKVDGLRLTAVPYEEAAAALGLPVGP